MKQWYVLAFAAWTFVLNGLTATASDPTPKQISSSIRFFSGAPPPRPTPDTTVLHEPANAAVLLACQTGATVPQLHRRGLTNVEASLDTLAKARVILRRKGRCFPALPLVVGRHYAKACAIARAVTSRVMHHTSQAVARLSDAVSNDAMLYRYDIALAAWEQGLPSSALQALRDTGGVDNSGAFIGFRYHARDQVDVLLEQLRKEYATAVTGVLNLRSASQALRISQSDALIILLHQVAYCLLEELDRTGTLRYAEALRRGSRPNPSRALLSIRLNERPVKADHAIAAFIRRAGRGDQEIAVIIRDALRSDPTNGVLWMYLGLSLYEIADYAAALDTFRKLHSLEPMKDRAEERRMREWSQIWMGHMQDLLGLRDEAVRSYLAVQNGTSIMRHAQYGIGPVSAGDWSRQRLEQPFTRR